MHTPSGDPPRPSSGTSRLSVLGRSPLGVRLPWLRASHALAIAFSLSEVALGEQTAIATAFRLRCGGGKTWREARKVSHDPNACSDSARSQDSASCRWKCYHSYGIDH